jgi:hypothetical protein
MWRAKTSTKDVFLAAALLFWKRIGSCKIRIWRRHVVPTLAAAIFWCCGRSVKEALVDLSCALDHLPTAVRVSPDATDYYLAKVKIWMKLGPNGRGRS